MTEQKGADDVVHADFADAAGLTEVQTTLRNLDAAITDMDVSMAALSTMREGLTGHRESLCRHTDLTNAAGERIVKSKFLYVEVLNESGCLMRLSRYKLLSGLELHSPANIIRPGGADRDQRYREFAFDTANVEFDYALEQCGGGKVKCKVNWNGRVSVQTEGLSVRVTTSQHRVNNMFQNDLHVSIVVK